MAKKEAIDNINELTGLQKSAVLLMGIDQDTASMLLKELDTETVEDITRQLATLGAVEPEVRDGVVEEFFHMSMARSWVAEGGIGYAAALLRKSVDSESAQRIIQDISQIARRTPFTFLQKADSENLLTFIQDEHPQTIALIVSHLPHDKSAEILGGLQPDKQLEVVRRVANMEQTNPEVIREVERGLESRLSAMLMQSFEKAGGVETVAEILNLVDRATEKNILDALEPQDPELVEEIRKLMFVFDDIMRVDERGIQAVLKEVDNSELALALKTANEEVRDKIFRNMSERASEMIKEDMDFLGPVRLSDVEAAQQRIVDIVRRLEEAGEIVIEGRGGSEEDVIV